MIYKYYKIINGKNFIGIGTNNDFRAVQKAFNLLVACSINEAQYIQIGDNLYHASWMRSENEDVQTKLVEVVEIEKEEYDKLYSSVETGEEIIISDEENIQEPEFSPDLDDNTVATISWIKENKIKAMSNICEQTITNGFDIILSDNQTHHFSLSVQDQLNLISLSTMVSSGMTLIPYHADNELCKEYSVEDINLIINQATFFKTYHTTYFNSLKSYINSLNSVDTISIIEYGMEIPEEYQSDVLKSLLADM